MNRLQGTISEIHVQDGKLTLTLVHTVDVELEYDTENQSLTEKLDHICEGAEVEAKAEITGWKDMSFPHLSHDVLKGKLHDIEEIY